MSEQYRSEGKYWMSSYNFKPEVLARREQPAKVLVHDATLRDGEQTPGVVIRKEDKVRIAKALDLVGVDRVEAGMPAVSAEDYEAIEEIIELKLKAKVFTFARAMKEDVDKAVASVVHSCVNGLGERTGNAAPVLELSGVPIAQNKPVVGEGNYTRESGIGANLVVEQPLAMFATHPALTGRAGKVVLGKKSGKPSITFKLKELGLSELDDDKTAAVFAEVKRLGNEKRGLLTDEEFAAIVVNFSK